MKKYINLSILIIAIVITSVFSIDIKEPYPKKIIELFSEPSVRFLVYLAIYFISIYNLKIGLSLIIIVLLLHMDYIMLVESDKNKL
jgi:hypothetical protein